MLLDAVTRGRIYQVKFLLESAFVNINEVDGKGQTPLMKAVLLDDKMHRTRYKLVRVLLEHGANVNVTDKDGRTVLMLAAIRGKADLAAKILEKSILDLDLNAGDQEGNTALFHAASKGYPSIVSLLIKALKRFGLEIDKKNHMGMTAILEATRNGHDQCARVLVVEGDASLTIRDPENKMNAYEWAEKLSLMNLLELIKLKRPAASEEHVENSNKKISEGASSIAGDKIEAKNPVIELLENRGDNGEVLQQKESLFQPLSRTQSRQSITVDTLTVPRVMQSLRLNTRLQMLSFPDFPRETPRTQSPAVETTCFSDTASFQEREGGTLSNSYNDSRNSCTSVSLTRRKSSAKSHRRSSTAGANPTATAKSEVLRLLQLYGVQTSETYRKGYDLTGLPPSGYWPDPALAHLHSSSSSCDNFDQQDRDSDMLSELSSRLSSRRKSTAVLDVPCAGRRMSVVGGARDGRKMSTAVGGLGVFDRRAGALGGRKMSVAQSAARGLHDGLGRRPAVDRRVSMIGRPLMERPVLSRKNYSTLGVLGS